MAMDGDDDMFAGMDFVTFSDDLGVQLPSHPHDLPNHQPVSNHHVDDDHGALLQWKKSEQDRRGHSINSILAAYDTPSVSSSPIMQSSEPSKSGIRRKKRGMRIGYGRIADDGDHDTRSSLHDETSSNNGSALDEQISVGSISSFHNEGSLSIDPKSKDLPDLDVGHVHGHDYGLGVVSDANIIGSDVSQMEVTVEDATKYVQTEDFSPDGTSELEEDNKIHDGSIVEKADVSITDSIHDENDVKSSFASSDRSAASQSNVKIKALSEGENGHTEFASVNDASTQENGIELDIIVPLELCIEERLLFINSAIARNVKCIQQKIATVSQARKAAAQKRRQATEKVSSTSAKFKQVEEEIEAACEREDFDNAESLNEALAIAEKARETALQEFRDAEMEYDKYGSKMQEVLQMQVANEEKGCTLLDQLAVEALDAANHMKETAEERGRKVMIELAAEEEAAKLKKKKLMLEIRIVEEAKSELGNVINSSIETELQEKSNLMKKRQALVEELDALLAVVKIKEEEIAAHDKQIGDLDENISSRVAGFEKESLGLGTELQNLLSSLESLERELEDLGVQRTKADNEMTQAQAEEEKLLDLSSTVKIESQKLQDAISVRKNIAQTALVSKEKRLKLASEEKQLVEVVQSLKNQSISLRTAIQDLTSEKAKVQQESLSATQKILSMEKRAPEIESEKKLAAASRNFKEAGRLANEAKALLSSKREVTLDLGRITADLQKLDEEIDIQMSALADLDKQLVAKEREAAMARCERLRLITCALRDERDAAAELEDFEEAESLHIEAEAADKEADELQKQYGFEGEVYTRTLSKVIRFTDPTVDDPQNLEKDDGKIEDAVGTVVDGDV